MLAGVAITYSTSAKAVLSRTRRTLLHQGSLCCTHRSITSLGYTSLSIVMLTCSHTLSVIVISRNLYIESSLCVFLSGRMPDGSFLVFCFLLIGLSEMYWRLRRPGTQTA